ncbi:ABC transporter ATP-binding protein [Microbacterium jiangjiandongii]|uniref:ABC transporter ATP-binding protein n=1 Tax=Microbacterium jiangjiandongii TaxID=3049071 RepID=UPI0035B58F17
MPVTSAPRDESAASAPAALPDQAPPLLRVRDLGVRYEGATASAPTAASLSIDPGEVVLLLGPSGSGKSTLALALNGLIPQAVPAAVTGSVRVAGQDAATTPVAHLAARVGMVFQDPDAQLVTGTLLDEVAFGPENLRVPAPEVLARAEEALRRVGLWERRAENPDHLSGGGRQRLAIACALALQSELLVLDEPTANLDPQGIEEVYRALADVAATGDRAILLIEHNLDAAIGLVDRVIVLDAAGRTVMDGPVGEVLRGRAAELHDMGVWLPTATLAALRLRRAGYVLDPLPLSPGELRDALQAEAPPLTATGTADDAAPASLPARRTTAPVVQARGLTLTRGRREVLHDVHLEVRAGEFVAVVGANGAGKTTLVQALAGVVRPPRGQVDLGGIDPGRADARTLHRRIGFVFQNPEHQFIAGTAFDELAHGLRLQKLPEPQVRARTDELLHRFGLADKAAVHPFLLSGGQKRRLSVGTALVAGAPVLVLDEPTFGQDRARADELLTLLRDLNRQGTTIIVVTHDMQLVTEYADRTVVLGDGRMLADAATAEVFADDALLARAGLRLPPLREALRGAARHPQLLSVVRLADLPGGDA